MGILNDQSTGDRASPRGIRDFRVDEPLYGEGCSNSKGSWW